MTMKPALLFYCQHSLGMGHLVRALELATALAREFAVVFLSGGRFPVGIDVPQEVTIVDLPPLGMDAASQLISLHERYSVDAAKALRQWRIMDTFKALRPAAILIELFPFGRKKFADEIIPLLEAARAMSGVRPRVFCSLRDILVGGRRDQQLHDDRAARTANTYFDAVLVHADAAFVRLEETFQPSIPLEVPVHYTGFVTSVRRPAAIELREQCVLISAGGGMVGAPLLRAAAEAQRRLGRDAPLPMRIVAGPFLPDEEWRALCRTASAAAGIEVIRTLPKLGGMFSRVTASISQCGYNTAMEILASGVPALVVPFSQGYEDEQMSRARRLARLGLVRVLEPSRLTPSTLAEALSELCRFRPKAVTLDLDGARATADLIARLVAEGHGARKIAFTKDQRRHLGQLA
jgi:predicted glycosyltransferase